MKPKFLSALLFLWLCVPIEAAPTISAEIDHSGQLVYLYALNGGIHSTIMTVTAAPTILVNGVAVVPTGGPYWSDSTKDWSGVAYQVQQVKPTDVVTVTTTASWATCAAGALPAVTAQSAANWTGQRAKGVGAFMQSGRAVPVPGAGQAPRRMRLGYNASWTGKLTSNSIWSMWRNVVRGSTQWTNVATADSHGHPVTISASSSASITGGGLPNGVDGRGLPIVMGQWGFRAIEANPTAPMAVSLSVYGQATIVSSSGPVPVNAAGATQWLWDVEYTSATPSSYPVILVLTISGSGAGGGGNWTLSGEEFTAPGDSWNGCVSSSRFRTWMKGAKSLRIVDVYGFDGQSNRVDAKDLQDPLGFNWNPPPATIPFSTVRNYSVATSPNVLFSQKWPGSTAAGAVAVPATPGVGFLNWSGAGTGWYVGEIVTPAPHGIRTGQWFTVSAAASPVTISSGPNATSSIWINGAALQAYATSPTSFAYTQYGGVSNGATLPGGINNVVGSQSIVGSVQVGSPDAGAPPFEAVGQILRELPGCALIVPCNVGASDNCIYAEAFKLLSTAPPTELIIALGNEIWSSDYATGVAYAYAQLGVTGAPGGNQYNFQVARSARVYQIWRQVQAQTGWRGKISLTIDGQWGYASGPITWLVQTANSWNAANPQMPCPIDYMMVASYVNTPANPTFKTAMGQLPLGVFLELTSHWLRYNTGYLADSNSPNATFFPTLNAALASYQPCVGQAANHRVKLGAYECGVAYYSYATAAQVQDFRDDPEQYWLESCLYETLQYGGMDLIHRYNICMPINSSVECFGQYTWGGQLPGMGLGNQFISQTGQFNPYNQSPGGQAALDWMSATR